MDIWTDRELAAEWKCEVRLIQDMCIDGRLTAFKAGRAWRITDHAKREFEQGQAKHVRTLKRVAS